MLCGAWLPLLCAALRVGVLFVCRCVIFLFVLMLLNPQLLQLHLLSRPCACVALLYHALRRSGLGANGCDIAGRCRCLSAAWSCTAVHALQRCLLCLLRCCSAAKNTQPGRCVFQLCSMSQLGLCLVCCAFFCSVLPWSVILF